MRLSPRDFLAGRILMLGFLLVLLSRDLFNLLYEPAEPARLAFSLLLVTAVCVSYGWFWLRAAGTGAAVVACGRRQDGRRRRQTSAGAPSPKTP